MKTVHIKSTSQVVEREWVSFPGGELQAPRPTVLCPACRAKVQASSVKPARQSNHPLCFACYRASMERERALKAAGELNTASEARFQSTLPFEPVNRSRLARLQSERAVSRVAARAGVGQYVDKRRQAQIAARSVLERIVIGLRERNATSAERDRVLTTATHAAELQLPEAWLPFVMSR
ncbi:MAG TPA: hypothetical protein VF456_22525 [Vicinamibacterales bacterium]